MNKVYYIGLDVHKDSIAIAYTNSESRAEAIFYGTCGGGITTAERKLRKLAKKLEVTFQDLKVCYEAGPNWIRPGPTPHRFGRGLRALCTFKNRTKT